MARALVIFDDTCRMCTRSARLVRAFDWLHRLDTIGFTQAVVLHPDVAARELDEGLRVRFPDGSMTIGIDAVRSIAIRTPLGALVAWLLYVPPVRALGARLYAWVAARRHGACELTAPR